MSKSEAIVRVTVDLNRPETFPNGYIDKEKVDVTSETQIKLQEQEDDDLAILDALNKNT
jgi:putative transcriptional regulator